jgi:RNA polymerase sigma factor (sigma-70 family)
MEVQLASYQYFVSPNARNEYNENQLEWLHDRLANLSPDQMNLYVMKFQDGLSEREIGKKLGISNATVNRKLHKMFDDLRAEYEED